MNKLSQLHHIGIAVADIEAAILEIGSCYDVSEIGEIVYDPLQKAHLCLATLVDGTILELVSGEIVQTYLKNNCQIYHHCYEVEDLDATLEHLIQHGARILSYPKPAKLFGNRRVAFLSTLFGLIELLEKEQPVFNNIYLAGNQSLEPIEDEINNYAQEIAFPITIECAPFNQLLQECIHRDSVLRNYPDTIVIVLGFEDKTYWNELCEAIRSATFKAQKRLICILPYARGEEEKIFPILKNMQTCAIEKSFEIVNLNQYCPLTWPQIYDEKAFEIAHIPYKQIFYDWMADFLLRFSHHDLRRPYKLIAVDCDNTLWSGVCAEDSFSSIVISKAHLMLQRKLIELSEQGTLIVLVSKNNPDDVWHIIDNHSGMLLKRQHIIEAAINWNDKYCNIIELSETYQIATESVIFIDDNPVEIASVQRMLPDVLTILFSEDSAAMITCAWQFDTFTKTGADHLRSNFYRQEMSRQQLKQSFYSLKDFICSLQLVIDFQPIQHNSFARVKQMLVRITQFNTSCHASDICLEHYVNDTSVLLSISDRFGEYGESGLILSVVDKNILRVDAILLSCRVLNRGMEAQLVEKLISIAKDQGLDEIHVAFQKRSRNQPAQHFLEQCVPVSQYPVDDYVWYVFLTHDMTWHPQSFTPAPVNNRQLNPQQMLLNKIIHNVIEKKCRDGIAQNNRVQPLDICSRFLEKVAQLCAMSTVSVNDNFMYIGGDSIKATYLAAWLYEHYQLNIDMVDILGANTLQNILAQAWKGEKSTIPKLGLSVVSALPTQKWLYWIDQIYGNSWFYNMPLIFQIKGMLNRAALIHALNTVVTEHEAFHSEFFEDQGELYMRRIPAHLSLIEISAEGWADDKIDALFIAETQNQFDLNKGPLIRFTLLKRSETEHFLITNKHHIISDGWSDQILFNGIQHAYMNFEGSVVQKKCSARADYYDYCHWAQQQHVNQFSAEERCSHTNHIGAVNSSALPYMGFIEQGRRHLGIYHALYFSPETSQKILHAVGRLQTTPYVFFLLLYHRCLQDMTQQQQQLILSPFSGRQRPECLEMIGCFVNLLIIRLTSTRDISLQQAIQDTSRSLQTAMSFAHIPFFEMIQALTEQQGTLPEGALQVMLAMQNMNIGCLTLSGLDVRYFRRGYNSARVSLILEMEYAHDRFVGGFYYNPLRMSEEWIKHLVSRLFYHLDNLINVDSLLAEENA